MHSSEINRPKAVPADATRKVQKTGSHANRQKQQSPKKKMDEDEGEEEDEQPKDESGRGKIVNVVA